ncbi:DUF262 domain-containing protein [Pseudomonas aeruginosa]|uniref:DUF262 domain-containing protein n=1 Tax=Pseudomonas aeruginosa TaxID=287 RepID=UPI0034E0647B
MSRDLPEFEQHLLSIIKPLHAAKWHADYRWFDLERSITKLGEDYGGLELNPDFQRGHVWSVDQQEHFIANCLRGVVAASGFLIQFNCADWSDEDAESDLPKGLQCVDGLQRFTAVTEFVKGNVKPFGYTAQELLGTQFSPKKMYMRVAIHAYTKRADLLSHYLALNAGGTQHSAEEIERVRGLLATAQASA